MAKDEQNMKNLEMEKWSSAAEQIEDPPPLGTPLRVLYDEAGRLAEATRLFWKHTGDRPGLENAGPRLRPGIADELLTLTRAVQEAQERYVDLISHEMNPSELVDRAEALLIELAHVLEWHEWREDDDESFEHRSVYAAREIAREAGSASELGFALYDYACAAQTRMEALRKINGFDPAVAEEALEVSKRIVDVDQTTLDQSDPIRRAIRARNRLVVLLERRMRLVRAAARFVFRDEPEVLDEFTSDYENLRQAAQFRVKRINRAMTRPRNADVALRLLPRNA